ncbi:MAG: ATP-binding protein [bacterium]
MAFSDSLSISDTGTGIQPENIEKVFEPLFTTKAKGIGLGLAISRMLVAAHKGSLLLDSEFGSGSIFTLRLPAYAEEEK